MLKASSKVKWTLQLYSNVSGNDKKNGCYSRVIGTSLSGRPDAHLQCELRSHTTSVVVCQPRNMLKAKLINSSIVNFDCHTTDDDVMFCQPYRREEVTFKYGF